MDQGVLDMNKLSADYKVLAELTQTFGPSGNEGEIASVITRHAKGYSDFIETDKMGSLLVRKKGQGRRIMISCHMDEIGIIVIHIDKNGFLYFAPVGGIRNTILLSKRVQFANGTVGIVNKEQDEAVSKKPERYYIDIGALSEQEAKEKVKVEIGRASCRERV